MSSKQPHYNHITIPGFLVLAFKTIVGKDVMKFKEKGFVTIAMMIMMLLLMMMMMMMIMIRMLLLLPMMKTMMMIHADNDGKDDAGGVVDGDDGSDNRDGGAIIFRYMLHPTKKNFTEDTLIPPTCRATIPFADESFCRASRGSLKPSYPIRYMSDARAFQACKSGNPSGHRDSHNLASLQYLSWPVMTKEFEN